MGMKEELTNIPGLEDSDRVVIKKLGYGSLNRLRSKTTKAEINPSTGQISANLDLGDYMKYLLVYGIDEAPFFKGCVTAEQKYDILERDDVSSETGEYLFKQIQRFNGFAEIDNLKKK